MLSSWLIKLAIIGGVVTALLTWPDMPGLLRSFLLSEYIRAVLVHLLAQLSVPCCCYSMHIFSYSTFTTLHHA